MRGLGPLWLLVALATGCYQDPAAQCVIRCSEESPCPAGSVCTAAGTCGETRSDCAAAGGDADVAPPTLAIGCRNDTTCAAIDGRVVCWGDHREGRIPGSASGEPAVVEGLPPGDPIVEIAAGSAHICARSAAGAVHCWGDASAGATGTGSSEVGAVPLALGATSIAAGESYTCAATAMEPQCWGTPACHELPTADGAADRPRDPELGPSVRRIVAGKRHLCAVGDEGLSCRGQNDRRQAGEMEGLITCPGLSATMALPELTELPLIGEPPLVVSGGDASGVHTCVVAGGALVCWGSQHGGRLGDGDDEGTSGPVRVELPCDPAAVATGDDHTCARCVGGDVYCWGSNEHGQLGQGTLADQLPGALEPLPVPGMHDVAALCAGDAHTCALRADGTAWCWGHNDVAQVSAGALEVPTASEVPLP